MLLTVTEVVNSYYSLNLQGLLLFCSVALCSLIILISIYLLSLARKRRRYILRSVLLGIISLFLCLDV